MKKVFVLLVFMFVLFTSLGINVNAEEPTTTTDESQVVTETTEASDELPEAGLKPGDALYGIDKFFEKIALKFTFSDEKRAERLSKIANERLAELNALDPEKAAVYADELFNEYGLSLEKANLFVQKLVSEGKISEEKLARLEAKVTRAEEHQNKMKDKIKDKISTEVKDKVMESLKSAKASIFERFEDKDLMAKLHEEGFGYGELLKLQAISKATDKSIDELLLIEGVVKINDEEEKSIDIDVLLTALNLPKEDLRAQLGEYKDQAKENMKTKMEEMKKKSEERRIEVKEKITEKVNGKRGK